MIKDKLLRNKVLITKADKGRSIVIIYQKEYEQNVEDFILNNGANEINGNNTTKLQKDLRSTINNCKILINTENKRESYQLKPRNPTFESTNKNT